MPAIVATTTPIQPPQTIRWARLESRPAGKITDRNTMPPMSSASVAKRATRSIAYTTPTVVLPPWLARRRLASASAFLTDPAAPTWKVNAPCTGCASAEVTRQVTTYVPSSTFGIDAATRLP